MLCDFPYVWHLRNKISKQNRPADTESKLRPRMGGGAGRGIKGEGAETYQPGAAEPSWGSKRRARPQYYCGNSAWCQEGPHRRPPS